jgi:hypothetical protein
VTIPADQKTDFNFDNSLTRPQPALPAGFFLLIKKQARFQRISGDRFIAQNVRIILFVRKLPNSTGKY